MIVKFAVVIRIVTKLFHGQLLPYNLWNKFTNYKLYNISNKLFKFLNYKVNKSTLINDYNLPRLKIFLFTVARYKFQSIYIEIF
jgi:hypothetical protein